MFIIDRIEDGIVTLEYDGTKHKDLPVNELPVGINVGDVLDFIDGKYVINKEETQKRRNEIIKLQENLFK